MKMPLATIALAATACVPLPPSPVTSALALARAESAFAAHSVREDMRSAFLAHFAPGGMLVRDGWVEAHAWLEPRPAPPIVLDWRPTYVEVATSGELGLSTGPWRITSKADASAPPAHGQFVSIWRRLEADGPWRVEVDLGIGHPRRDLWDAPLRTRVAGPAQNAAQPSLAAAEAAFAARSASAGLRAAYEEHAASDFRFYRNGASPTATREESLRSPALGDGPLHWSAERVETARSGDFGYARGAFAARAGADPAGYFLRAWRREAGRWRIVLDVANPAARR